MPKLSSQHLRMHCRSVAFLGVALLVLMAGISCSHVNGSGDPPGESVSRALASGPIVPTVAKRLTGTWELESRTVTVGRRVHKAAAHHVAIWNLNPIDDKRATGTLLMLESGVLERQVEAPALFLEEPDLVGANYSIGGYWKVEVAEVAEPRCAAGVAARIRFDGELEGSYGVLREGCYADRNTEALLCSVGAGGFRQVGVVQTGTGVEGVVDVWTGFTGLSTGEIGDFMSHELPRQPYRDNPETPLLVDRLQKVSADTAIHGQTLDEFWHELIENKTLIMGQLAVDRMRSR